MGRWWVVRSFGRSAIDANDDFAGGGVAALGSDEFWEGGGSDGFGGGDGGGAVEEGSLVGVIWRSSREGGGRNEQRCRGDGRCLEGEAVEDGAAGGEAGSTDGCKGESVVEVRGVEEGYAPRRQLSALHLPVGLKFAAAAPRRPRRRVTVETCMV